MTAVDFVLRSNTWAKPGGDLYQVQEYVKHLADYGYDAAIVEFRPGLTFREGSIVHIVNVDRPFDFLESVRAAKGHSIVVSPIHHSLRAVREMRLAERGQGLRSWVGRVLPEWGREWLAYIVRSIRGSTGSAETLRSIPAFARYLPKLPLVWRSVGTALDGADHVFLLANGEGQDLKDDTGWSAGNGMLVPNGAPVVPGNGASWEERSKAVLVAGRIEPRKRQVEIARAAVRLGLKVDFVGPVSSNADAYAREFAEVIAQSSEVRWLGAMPHEDLIEEMGKHRVLLNASWVEVQSLVDLEASFSGCFVIARSAGNSAEWLPDHVVVCESSSADQLLMTAVSQAESPSGPSKPDYGWTWPECAKTLSEAYAHCASGEQ